MPRNLLGALGRGSEDEHSCMRDLMLTKAPREWSRDTVGSGKSC